VTVDDKGIPSVAVHDVGQQYPEKWAPDQNLLETASSTSGNGDFPSTFAQITTDHAGNPTATIAKVGTARPFGFGDTLTFNPPDSDPRGAPVVMRVVPVLAGPAVPANKWTPNKTWDSVAQSSTTGSGTGLNVTVATDASGVPTVTLHDQGSGYKQFDQITFAA